MAAIYDDPRTAGQFVHHTLYVGDEPIITSALRAYSADDAPAVVLEGTTPTPLAPTAVGRPARVVLTIGGSVRWVDYIGEVVSVTEEEDGSGTFAASTAGYYQGGDTTIKFGAKTEYNHTPQGALYDMLRRLPYNRLAIPPILKPRFVRQAEEAFPMVAEVGVGVAAVEEEARLVQKDTFLNEAIAHKLPSVGTLSSQQPTAVWHVGRDIAAWSATPEGASRYYDVAVVRQDPVTGDYQRLVRQNTRIRYDKPWMAPPEGTTFYEELSTDEEDRRQEHAERTQAQIAVSMGYGGQHTGVAVTPYIDPRIEDYDGRDVVNFDREAGVTTRWRTTVRSQERNYTENTATYTTFALILSRKVRSDDAPIFPQQAPAPTAPPLPSAPLTPSDVLTPSDILVPSG